jgi:hypothetical protein
MGVRLGHIRVQPQRFGVRFAGLDQPIQRPQDVAEIIVQGAQIGQETDGFPSVRERFLSLAAIEQELAEIAPRQRQRRIVKDSLPEVVQRLVQMSLLAQ